MFHCLRQLGYVLIGVCLFVGLLAGLPKNYSTNFFLQNSGSSTGHGPRTEETIKFGGNPDHVALALG